MSTVSELAQFDPQPRSINDIVRVIQQLAVLQLGAQLPALPPNDGKTYFLKVKDGVLAWIETGSCP